MRWILGLLLSLSFLGCQVAPRLAYTPDFNESGGQRSFESVRGENSVAKDTRVFRNGKPVIAEGSMDPEVLRKKEANKKK